MSKAYKLDKAKMTITVDDANLTPADREDIKLYVLAGYEIRHKSKAKSREATKRADTIRGKQIEKVLEKDDKALAEYKKLKKDSGFFSARQFYRNYIATHKEATETTKEAEEKPRATRRTKKTAPEETETAKTTATVKTEE